MWPADSTSRAPRTGNLVAGIVIASLLLATSVPFLLPRLFEGESVPTTVYLICIVAALASGAVLIVAVKLGEWIGMTDPRLRARIQAWGLALQIVAVAAIWIGFLLTR